MKKSRWKIITGIILIIITLSIAFQLIAHFPSKISENISQIVNILCWGGIAGFLIFSYLGEKDKEDAGVIPIIPKPNSPEDIESLKARRSNILATILLLEFIGSMSSWITHNYYTGLTPDNIGTMFDVLVNLVFIYFIYTLYKNKNKKVLNYLLYPIILGSIGYIAIDIWKASWFAIAGDILFGAYFVFYAKMPVNRRNFRLANFVVLPLFIISTIFYAFSASYKITELSTKEQTQEASFVTASSDVVSKYNILLDDNDWTNYLAETRDLKNSLEVKSQKTKELLDTLGKLKKEIAKNPETDTFEPLSKKVDILFRLLKAHQILDGKRDQLVVFLEGLNLDKATKDQEDKYKTLLKEVDTAQKDVQDIGKELTDVVGRK